MGFMELYRVKQWSVHCKPCCITGCPGGGRFRPGDGSVWILARSPGITSTISYHITEKGYSNLSTVTSLPVTGVNSNY